MIDDAMIFMFLDLGLSSHQDRSVSTTEKYRLDMQRRQYHASYGLMPQKPLSLTQEDNKLIRFLTLLGTQFQLLLVSPDRSIKGRTVIRAKATP